MASASELDILLEARAELFSSDDYFSNPVELVAEAVLDNDAEFMALYEASALEAQAILSSLDLASYAAASTYIYSGATPGVVPPGYSAPPSGLSPNGVYPLTYPDPDTALLPPGITAVTVPVNRYHRDIWDLRIVFLSDGPLGVLTGATQGAAKIIACSITYNLSAGGSANVTLATVENNLVGARARIDINLNGGGWVPLFTGWLLPDSGIEIDYVEFTTQFTLVDSVAYLQQNRLAFSWQYPGQLDAKQAAAMAAHNKNFYPKWADGLGSPRAGTKIKEVISIALSHANFNYAAEFPDDGGEIGWTVEVTDEVPLDVIRMASESRRWHFRAAPDGTLKFAPAYQAANQLALTYGEIDLEPGIATTWGQSPINSIQVKGAPRRYTGVEYERTKIGGISFGGPTAQTPNGNYFELMRYTTPEKFPTKNITFGPALNDEGEELSYPLWIGGIALISNATVQFVDNLYNLLGRYVPPGYILVGGTPALYNDKYAEVLIFYTTANLAIEEIWPDFGDGARSPTEGFEFPVYADVLTYVEVDDQASVILEDAGSIAAFGRYAQSIYENPFISDRAGCELSAKQILDTSHRMGRTTFTAPYQQKFINAGVGAALTIFDPAGAIANSGIVESMGLEFSTDGRASVNFTVSSPYATE